MGCLAADKKPKLKHKTSNKQNFFIITYFRIHKNTN